MMETIPACSSPLAYDVMYKISVLLISLRLDFQRHFLLCISNEISTKSETYKIYS